MLVSRSLSASTASSWSAGIAAKASLVGAKIVNGPSPLSVSTRPASVTAVTRVDSTGLLLAAVAAGSWAMPSKLPAPSAGTAPHAGPNAVDSMSPMSSLISSAAVVSGAMVVSGAIVVSAGASVAGAASSPSSPQAAATSDSDAIVARTMRLRRRGIREVFTGWSFRGFGVVCIGGDVIGVTVGFTAPTPRSGAGRLRRSGRVRSARRFGLHRFGRWRER